MFVVHLLILLVRSHLSAGIHPTTISDSIQLAMEHAVEVLTAMSSPLSLSDRDSLLKSATTSKVRVCIGILVC